MVREDGIIYKSIIKGSKHLSDREVLASLFLSYGEDVATSIAEQLIQKHKTLKAILALSRQEMTFAGLTERQASMLEASASIRKRVNADEDIKTKQVVGSRTSYNALRPHLENLPHEEFWILILSRANRILRTVQISKGGVTGTVVDAKIIFREAISTPKACSIVLGHNHPSGNLLPSMADINLTTKLADAAKGLDLQVFDHIIVAGDSYYSFSDEGKL